jgi:multidrug transporter EmrE-like cation transporter
MNIPTRVVRLLLPSTRRGAVLAICAAAVFLVVETVLVILLKQVEPSSPVGVVYAVLTAMALLANFVVGVVAARKAVLALNASRARIVATGRRSAAGGAGFARWRPTAARHIDSEAALGRAVCAR